MIVRQILNKFGEKIEPKSPHSHVAKRRQLYNKKKLNGVTFESEPQAFNFKKKDTDREMHVIIFIKATCIPTMYEHVFIYTRQNC